jgi:hypothetical protein
MPSGVDKPRGVSVKDSAILSGADQFLLRLEDIPVSPPREFTVSFARLSSGAEFPGVANYDSSNSTAGTWTNGTLNYVWYRISQGSFGPWFGIESDIGGFPDDPDVIPIGIIDFNGVGAVNAILDARPWFDGGAGGGTSAVAERLKEILQHSVMEDALFDALVNSNNVDGANSTGSFTGPSKYELQAGQILQSNFASAPPDHLAVINQPFVAVLTDQLIDPLADIKIRVSRIASPGASGFPGAAGANWTDVPSNFSIVDLTAATGTNVLNIAIYNSSGSTYEIAGWGIYSNPVTAPGSVFVPKSGIHVGGTGLDVYNTNPASYIAYAANFGFTWNATTEELSWQAADGGTADNLRIEITDDLTGTVIQELDVADSPLVGVSPTDAYVFFDMDRSASIISLQVSPTPPIMNKDRFILGRRIANPSGGGDIFQLFNTHIIANSATTPASANSQYPQILIPNSRIDAIFAASSPSVSNPFATVNQLVSIPAQSQLAEAIAVAGGSSFTFASGTKQLGLYVISDNGSVLTGNFNLGTTQFAAVGGTTSFVAIKPAVGVGLFTVSASTGVWVMNVTSITATTITWTASGNAGSVANLLWVGHN